MRVGRAVAGDAYEAGRAVVGVQAGTPAAGVMKVAAVPGRRVRPFMTGAVRTGTVVENGRGVGAVKRRPWAVRVRGLRANVT